MDAFAEPSTDSSPYVCHNPTLVARGVWWEGGKRERGRLFLSSPFPSAPAPAALYAKTTGDGSDPAVM